MVIYLIMMDMPDFYVIIGINFLSRYGVEINKRKNKVRFKLYNGKDFIFWKGLILSMMISNVKVRKKLSKRYTAFLAHIVNRTYETVSGVRDTLVV